MAWFVFQDNGRRKRQGILQPKDVADFDRVFPTVGISHDESMSRRYLMFDIPSSKGTSLASKSQKYVAMANALNAASKSYVYRNEVAR